MSQMNRVSKANPCPICKSTDWCLIGHTLALCMRVQSNRPKQFNDGDTGYYHPLDGKAMPEWKPEKKREAPTIPVREQWERWWRQTKPEDHWQLALELGVSPDATMSLLAVKRDRTSWAFPMRDAMCNMVGLRIRTTGGHKFATPGSHGGLFIPEHHNPQATVFLPEGPTSTMAALTLGVYAIGRPSANSCIQELGRAIKELSVIRRAVIVADADPDRIRADQSVFNPGADGAEAVSEHLGIPNCTLTLPCKDFRVFLREGGTKATLDYLVEQCVWKHPSKSSK